MCTTVVLPVTIDFYRNTWEMQRTKTEGRFLSITSGRSPMRLQHAPLLITTVIITMIIILTPFHSED
jgi:hypothetical protein